MSAPVLSPASTAAAASPASTAAVLSPPFPAALSWASTPGVPSLTSPAVVLSPAFPTGSHPQPVLRPLYNCRLMVADPKCTKATYQKMRLLVSYALETEGLKTVFQNWCHQSDIDMFGSSDTVLHSLCVKFRALEGNECGDAFHFTVQDLELSKALVNCLMGQGTSSHRTETQNATRKAFTVPMSAASKVENRLIWWEAQGPNSFSNMKWKVLREPNAGLQDVQLGISARCTALDRDRMDAAEVRRARTTIASVTADLDTGRMRKETLAEHVSHLGNALILEVRNQVGWRLSE